MSLAGWAGARSRADDGRVTPIRVDYGHLASQYVEITLPPESATAPVALIVHGGDGQRVADGRLDLNRVVAVGHSAGGQLAGWLAARRSAVRLSSVISQAGVLDLVQAADTGVGGGAVEDFLGGSPAQAPAAYADASPIARVPLGVPSICIHGRADTVVPIEQSERFVAAARGAGDPLRTARVRRRTLRLDRGGLAGVVDDCQCVAGSDRALTPEQRELPRP